MAYYNTCPNCGSNLDPGEKCSCAEEKAQEQEKVRSFWKSRVKILPKTGQAFFQFDPDGKEAAGRVV